RPTADGAQIGALPERILVGGDVAAGASAPGDRARLTGSGAARGAADALLAEPRRAVAGAGAGRAEGAPRAVAGDAADGAVAAVAGGAVGVGRAAGLAVAVRAADVGAATLGRAGDAVADAVAERARRLDAARAAVHSAGGRGRIALAAAVSVAEAVGATAVDGDHRALLQRVLSGRDVGADAGAPAEPAGLAKAGTGGHAAGPLRAEARVAVGVGRAARADRLLAA